MENLTRSIRQISTDTFYGLYKPDNMLLRYESTRTMSANGTDYSFGENMARFEVFSYPEYLVNNRLVNHGSIDFYADTIVKQGLISTNWESVDDATDYELGTSLNVFTPPNTYSGYNIPSTAVYSSSGLDDSFFGVVGANNFASVRTYVFGEHDANGRYIPIDNKEVVAANFDIKIEAGNATLNSLGDAITSLTWSAKHIFCRRFC